MARTPNGVGPVQTSQVIFMTTPEVAGTVEYWRETRGIRNRSDLHREIYAAGLATLEKRWARKFGEPRVADLGAHVTAAKASPRGSKIEAVVPAVPVKAIKAAKR